MIRVSVNRHTRDFENQHYYITLYFKLLTIVASPKQVRIQKIRDLENQETAGVTLIYKKNEEKRRRIDNSFASRHVLVCLNKGHIERPESRLQSSPQV